MSNRQPTKETTSLPPNSSALSAAGAGSGLVSVDEAMAFLLARARPVPASERVAVDAALGRVLAEALDSAIDVPGHDNSAMDGYAVRSSDVTGAGAVRLRVSQRIAAGEIGQPLSQGEAARIFTGAPMPVGADAVVIQEDCKRDGDDVIVQAPVPCGDWVRPCGNDIKRGSCLLDAGTRLRPQELGLIASVGAAEVVVRRRLRVAVFSSGDELLQPGEALRPGAIYNSNRFTLRGLLSGLGCECVDLGTVDDTFEATRAALVDASNRADVVVSSGGMSVGEEDHVKAALEAAGQLEMWKVAVKPGKPLAYGRIGQADFIGLPGNPVSTLVTFCLFVRPFLLTRLGVVRVQPHSFAVEADFDWGKPVTRREYVRARLTYGESGEVRASLHTKQGSDVLTSTAWADGLVEIFEGRSYARGERVRYIPFSELIG